MTWTLGAQAIVAVVPILVALIGLRNRPDPERRRMAHDSAVLERLPPGSPAREHLLQVIERDAQTIAQRIHYTRDWGSFALGLSGAVFLGSVAVWLAMLGHWWALLLALLPASLWVVFVFGMFDSLQLRDQKAHEAERAEAKAAEAEAKAAKRAERSRKSG
jgi:hypothetical protein